MTQKKQSVKSPEMWKTAIAALVTAFVVVLFLVIYQLNKSFNQNIANEKASQLNAVTVQVSETFGDALSFRQNMASFASKLFSQGQYDSAREAAAQIKQIEQTLASDDGSLLVFVDKEGHCWDQNGKQGIWGDFDQITTGKENYLFISDSVSYEGVYWAFAQHLETEVEIEGENAAIFYAVWLCPVETLESYYASAAYDARGETYILNENGIRMYDDTAEGQILSSSYNIYKALRESEGGYGESFDSTLATLEQEGVANGVYVQNGQQYCYTLDSHKEYGIVVLYMIDSDLVAVDTTRMVSDMTRTLIYFCMGLVLLLSCTLYVIFRISGARKLYAQKEQSLREMEAVNSRLESANKALEDANKATRIALANADSANRAKSSFLSAMSHDIRTPLNAILGFQKLLDASCDNPEKVKEYSGKIAMSGEHLLALINDILDMSRIESGKTTLNLVPFDTDKLVDELKALISTQASAKEQEFIVENHAGDLHLVGDYARVSQILTNLLSNAVKYTPKGGKIEFLTECISAKKSSKLVTLKFVVRDNGLGMEEEFQKRIFEPFSREEHVQVSGIQGTGLGMSITKNLVDLMGGIITLQSKRGKGSTFTVELNFARADDTAQTAEKDTAAADLTNVLNGCRFLLAEDTAVNAEILTELLKMEGASCDVAHNGKEAVEQFEASAPQTYTAILMDVQMPVMNGYEAAKRIRAGTHPQAQTIPIAALTANAFAEDVQRALEAGMNTHIAKPVNMGKLREFVATLT